MVRASRSCAPIPSPVPLEEQLELFSIKVQDGPLTSRPQHIQPGDTILIGRKPTGTLLISDLRPGRNLYLLATGTGLAPWMSVIKDPETYQRFGRVVLCHGVRGSEDLAYRAISNANSLTTSCWAMSSATACCTTRRCHARNLNTTAT